MWVWAALWTRHWVILSNSSRNKGVCWVLWMSTCAPCLKSIREKWLFQSIFHLFSNNYILTRTHIWNNKCSHLASNTLTSIQLELRRRKRRKQSPRWPPLPALALITRILGYSRLEQAKQSLANNSQALQFLQLTPREESKSKVQRKTRPKEHLTGRCETYRLQPCCLLSSTCVWRQRTLENKYRLLLNYFLGIWRDFASQNSKVLYILAFWKWSDLLGIFH